jgi:hypothetical protein
MLDPLPTRPARSPCGTAYGARLVNVDIFNLCTSKMTVLIVLHYVELREHLSVFTCDEHVLPPGHYNLQLRRSQGLVSHDAASKQKSHLSVATHTEFMATMQQLHHRPASCMCNAIHKGITVSTACFISVPSQGIFNSQPLIQAHLIIVNPSPALSPQL